MKWITKDYKGNEQVWYSQDVIKNIMHTCVEFGIINHYDKRGKILAQTANPLSAKIMRIIESEEKS